MPATDYCGSPNKKGFYEGYETSCCTFHYPKIGGTAEKAPSLEGSAQPKDENKLSGESLLMNSVLKAEELCRIISTCARSNVAVLKFGDIYVRFDTKVAPRKQSVKKPTPGEDQTEEASEPSSPDKEISEEAQRINQETHERDELLLKEQQLNEMILTDPLEFEKQLASGELIDVAESDEEA